MESMSSYSSIGGGGGGGKNGDKNYGTTVSRLRNDGSMSLSKAVDEEDFVSSYLSGSRMGSADSSQHSNGLCTQCAGHCLCPCRHKRYLVSVLCSIGFVIFFGFRCNVAAATSHFRDLYNVTEPREGNGTMFSHQWSASMIGALESSYFLGYLATQLPGGILANKLPPTAIFSIAILASSVLNLLLPAALSVSVILAIVIRVLQGLLEGCCFPACHGIWRYWAPPLDRSRLVSLAFSGAYAGVFLGLLLSGMLTERLGWQSPFYFYGAAGILWFCVWQGCVYEKPAVHPCITSEERISIEVSIGENMDVTDRICDLPWRKILTSMPVYAIIVANFARNWSLYLLITQPTKYFGDVFKYHISKSGYYSSLPHLVMAIVVPLGGQLADELRKRWLTTTVVRKIFNCTGFSVEAAFLLGVGFTSDAKVAIGCLTVAVSFSGLAISGFNVNHLDIAPRYASILMGLSNGVGAIAGLLVPPVTVNMVQDHKRESWSKVFLIAALIHFAGVIFYAIFASGEKQDWAEAPVDSEDRWRPPTFELSRSEPGNTEGASEDARLSPESPLFATVPKLMQEPAAH